MKQKNKAAQSLQKLSVKSQKLNPNYSKIRQGVSKKANEAKTRLAIKRAIVYLIKNGYKVVGNLIYPAKKN